MRKIRKTSSVCHLLNLHVKRMVKVTGKPDWRALAVIMECEQGRLILSYLFGQSDQAFWRQNILIKDEGLDQT